jgi:hypothetical protein
LILVDVVRQHAAELQQQIKQKSEWLENLRRNKHLFEQHPHKSFLQKLTNRDIWTIVDTELEVHQI